MRGAVNNVSSHRFSQQLKQTAGDHHNDDADRRCSHHSDEGPSYYILDEAHVQRIWREYKRTGAISLRNTLIIHYMHGHVRTIARRLHAQLPRQVDIEDLVDEAYDALADVIERFDMDRDVRFETFSSMRIVGAMRDYLRRLDLVPRLARTRAKLVQAGAERFHKLHGRTPDHHELKQQVQLLEQRRMGSAGTSITERAFTRMVRESNPTQFVSFNGNATESESDSDAMAGFEDLRTPTPLSQSQRDDLRRWVTEGFARRDRLIIILYYYEQMTMKDIGRTLGCSESRVSQRLDSIIKCLRSRLNRGGGSTIFEMK